MMNIENEKCRLCLSEHEKSDLTPIFTDSETSGLSLAAQIMICLSLPVQERDSLPDGICDVCENRVKDFYAFRETCLIAYYSLLRHGNFHENDEDYSEAYVETEVDNSVAACAKDTQTEQRETEIDLQEDIAKVTLTSPETYPHEEANSIVENSNFDEALSQCSAQNDAFAEEISTTANVEDSAYNCTATKTEPRSEKSLEETKNNEVSTEIVRYKCIYCEYLFSDLETASIHSAECLRVNESVFVQQTDNADFTDGNLHETEENRENREEENFQRMISMETSHTTVEQNEGKTKTIGKRRNSRITEKSAVGRKRKTRDCKRLHPCEDCQSVFPSAALLRRHSFVHTGQRPFECPLCNKRFCQVGQLNFHKNFHINPRYRCDVCQKPFLRPSDIEKHMRTHTGEKPYDCAICNKSFAQLVALQQHERVHTGDKPFVCEICGKKFSQKANKTKHVKIHKEGEKPHTCDICGRSFSDLEEMKLHRAGHNGGKPRKCNYCDESFRKTSELTQHERRCHTFEKPHECAFCHKAFYSLYNLKQHIMVHTGQKPYACSYCNIKFTQKGNLTKHIERKHSDDTSSKDNSVISKIDNDDEEILTMANDFLNTTNPLIIEREEVVEIENLENV